MIDLKTLALRLAMAMAGLGLLSAAAWAENTSAEADEFEDRYRTIEPGVGGRGKAEFCRAYAGRAVSAEETNQELECGFSGPAWHGQRSSHYHWCLNTPRERVREETRMRRRQLEECRGGDGLEKEVWCQSYARRAVRTQELNEELGCGFGGPAWHFNRDRHYRRCMNTPREQTESEMQRRRDRLDRCRGFD